MVQKILYFIVGAAIGAGIFYVLSPKAETVLTAPAPTQVDIPLDTLIKNAQAVAQNISFTEMQEMQTNRWFFTKTGYTQAQYNAYLSGVNALGLAIVPCPKGCPPPIYCCPVVFDTVSQGPVKETPPTLNIPYAKRDLQKMVFSAPVVGIADAALVLEMRDMTGRLIASSTQNGCSKRSKDNTTIYTSIGNIIDSKFTGTVRLTVTLSSAANILLNQTMIFTLN